jgi:hypothetical protein
MKHDFPFSGAELGPNTLGFAPAFKRVYINDGNKNKKKKLI